MEFIPYGRQSVDDDDVAAVAAALRSDWLTTGPAVDEFEQALSRSVGAPAVAVSSGTAALHCAYHAARVGPGTAVITSPLTFVATAAAAIHLGASVRFCDVTDDTLNLDPDAVKAAVSDHTRVVSAVDFAGHPAELEPLRDIAHAGDALLVEDASHSIGATYHGMPVGSVADLTTFSFHPVKTITTGEGGAVSSPQPALLARAERFRNHGLVRAAEDLRTPDEGGWHQEVHELGLNYRMPDVLAALGTSQLARLPRFVARRAELVARYCELLSEVDGIRLPGRRDDVEPAWHLFAIRIADGRRRAVYDTMRAAGIGVQVHYLPVHRHPVFADAGYRAGMCPVAEQAYDELLSLPLFPDLTYGQQDRVVDELLRALR